MRTLPSDLLPALILLRLSATDPSFSRDLKGRKCMRGTVNKICFLMSLDSPGIKDDTARKVSRAVMCR